MKLFVNKLTGIEAPVDPNNPEGPTEKITYAQMIISALKSFRPEGYTVEDLRQHFRLIDQMETIKDKEKELKMEDSDVKKLKEFLKDFKWAVVERDIIEMTDHVSKMKNCKA